MIALLDRLPLIQLSSGQVVSFDTEWLIRALRRAAARAGYAQWWLAEHVVQSVAEYLRSQEDATLLPVERLESAVRETLHGIGYSEVARHFEHGLPRVAVSLLSIAREAGAGYELAFFDILARRLHELVRQDVSNFELSDLEPCVKVLRGKKMWGRDCDILRCEIIAFVREQTMVAAGQNEVMFALT